ncbi:MAG: hypothetical protein Q7R76_07180 [Candidatus Woesearchaeota archaeon]|nr:hypothetical protein [Candidatus Woesearchaeota archaeon]
MTEHLFPACIRYPAYFIAGIGSGIVPIAIAAAIATGAHPRQPIDPQPTPSALELKLENVPCSPTPDMVYDQNRQQCYVKISEKPVVDYCTPESR